MPGSLGDYDFENRRENGKVRAYQNLDTGTILPIANQLIPDILVKTLFSVCFLHIRNWEHTSRTKFTEPPRRNVQR